MHALTLHEIAAGDPILGLHRFIERRLLAAALGATELPKGVAEAVFAMQENSTGRPRLERVTHDDFQSKI